MNKMPKVNLEGLNPEEAEQVMEQFYEWATGQLEDYFSAPLTDDVTDEQAEVIEWVLDK
jgi:hypothetical protein